PKIRKPWEQTSHKSQSIVISPKRSSPSLAAPPPSFSERTYKSNPTNKSTALFHIYNKIIQTTVFIR
ncbi:hypothetical protein, partial [Agrobacterium sp. AGB01]|uniref:hypothetical protein n=1 Tax=Agrobacterium sp. AGB01 TaxID=2769302 RepID=UPI001AED86CD